MLVHQWRAAERASLRLEGELSSGGRVADEPFVSVRQAAERSGLSIRQISWLLQHGVIETIKPGHDWLLRMSSLTAYLKTDRKPGPKPKSRKRTG